MNNPSSSNESLQSGIKIMIAGPYNKDDCKEKESSLEKNGPSIKIGQLFDASIYLVTDGMAKND